MHVTDAVSNSAHCSSPVSSISSSRRFLMTPPSRGQCCGTIRLLLLPPKVESSSMIPKRVHKTTPIIR